MQENETKKCLECDFPNSGKDSNGETTPTPVVKTKNMFNDQEIKVGKIVTFGQYKQDNNTAKGQKPITWQVLEVKEGKALLISQYALDCRKYHTYNSNVTWMKCTLRTWLNNTFLNNAFTSAEQKKIAVTDVSADKNPHYKTNPGQATDDKVFLLSITEFEKYFSTEEARVCSPTAYAKEQGVKIKNTSPIANAEDACDWMLRTPGKFPFTAIMVNYDGSMDVNSFSGTVVNYPRAIRPALWVTLDSCEAKMIPMFNNQEAKKNQIVTFGKYVQNKDISKGKKPIAWQVLEIKAGKILLISQYALDCQQYDPAELVPWETCALRTWLNDTFLNKAFSLEEQKKIAKKNEAADKKARQSTNDGEITNEKIFLLSEKDVVRYFKTEESRKCAPTAYATAQGAEDDFAYNESRKQKACWWWLLTPGLKWEADYVDAEGCVGDSVPFSASGAVRPALWANLDSTELVQQEECSEEVSLEDSLPKEDEKQKNLEIIKFGKYPQSKSGNDRKAIEWIVLTKESDKMLIISKYALDCQKYNSVKKQFTWENSSLRTWLNDTFLNSAFSATEQKKIVMMNISADKNPDYDTDPGNATNDKVFLLSITEAGKYFSSNDARGCAPTAYAKARGISTSSYCIANEETCDWWLRTPGNCQDSAIMVNCDGSIDKQCFLGVYLSYPGAVRPALWIKLQ